MNNSKFVGLADVYNDDLDNDENDDDFEADENEDDDDEDLAEEEEGDDEGKQIEYKQLECFENGFVFKNAVVLCAFRRIASSRNQEKA